MTGIKALEAVTNMINHGIRMGSKGHGFWLMYELLTGSLSMYVLMEDKPMLLGALMLRLCKRDGDETELMPLLRLLDLEPDLALDMPKYKETRGKGLKLFKGKAGKGMPEEIAAALEKKLEHPLRSGPAYEPAGEFEPAKAVRLPGLRELRQKYRNWLMPHALDLNLEYRALPSPFDAEFKAASPIATTPSPPARPRLPSHPHPLPRTHLYRAPGGASPPARRPRARAHTHHRLPTPHANPPVTSPPRPLRRAARACSPCSTPTRS